MTTEKHMLNLLRARHSSVSEANVPRWVYAEQVSQAATHGVSIVDAVAIDGFTSQYEIKNYNAAINSERRVMGPSPVHGFEVKISRSDWLREYRTEGKKSWTWGRYCNYYWLVVPEKNIVKPEELPEGWGLLVGEKRLRKMVDAQWRLAEPMPLRVSTNIARASIRQHLAPYVSDPVKASKGVL